MHTREYEYFAPCLSHRINKRYVFLPQNWIARSEIIISGYSSSTHVRNLPEEIVRNKQGPNCASFRSKKDMIGPVPCTHFILAEHLKELVQSDTLAGKLALLQLSRNLEMV
jgi:hypothetical protein